MTNIFILSLKIVQEPNDRSKNKYSNAWTGSQCQSQSYFNVSLENNDAVRSMVWHNIYHTYSIVVYIDNAG